MTCKETIGIICEYLEGTLAISVAAAVQRHIDRCRNCKLVHETAKQTLEAYFDRDFVPHRVAQGSHVQEVKVA